MDGAPTRPRSAHHDDTEELLHLTRRAVTQKETCIAESKVLDAVSSTVLGMGTWGRIRRPPLVLIQNLKIKEALQSGL